MPEPEPRAPAPAAKAPDHGVRLFMPVWTERVPNEQTTAVPTKTCWLVFVGKDALVDEVVTGLRNRGDTVTMVTAGSKYEQIAPNRYMVGAADDADYTALFRALRAADALPDRVVHMWLADRRRPDDRSILGNVQTGLEHGFYGLLALVKALAANVGGRPLHVDVVSRGVFGAGGDETIEPARASVVGIMNLLPQELAPATARHLDLRVGPASAAATAQEAQPLLRELLDAEITAKVAIRGRKTWTWSFREEPVAPVSATPKLLRERGVYLITGGLGGIGLVVAEDLARLVSAKIVLTSRSPFLDRGAWATTLADPKADRALVDRIRSIERIEELGGSVLVVQADVADRAAMQRAIELAENELGRISGVFHSAGIAGGGMMALKPRKTAEGVFGPKVDGLRVIDELFADRVDFVVLFSSIASVATEFGLSDYGGANAVLDAYAHARAHAGPKPHVVSITWAGWSEVGMAVNTQRVAPGSFRAMQYGLELEKIGHPLVGYNGRLADDDSVTTQFLTHLEPSSHWMLREHQFNGTQVVPGTAFLEMARAAYTTMPGAPAGALVELREVMFMAPLAVTGETDVMTVFFGEGPERGFSVMSAPRGHNGRQWTEYARGRIGHTTSAAARRIDVDALWSSLPAPAESWKFSTDVVTLGDHWQSIVERRSDGSSLTMGRLELPAAYREEAKEYGIHPSLLDCANAIMLDLPEATRGGKGFLPFSYGRVVVHRPMPDRVTTVIRHKSEPSSQIPSFDIALVADDGEVVVDITDFSVRVFERNKKRELLSSSDDAPEGAAPARPARRTIRAILGLPERRDARLTNDAGITALRQVLEGRLGPHVIAINEDLAATLTRASALTTDRVADGGAPKAAAPRPAPAPAPARPAAPPPAPAQAPAAPTGGSVEEILLRFMRDALGNEIDLDDDFFEHGGNSLAAVQVAARVRNHFQVELPLDRLFDTPTVRELAKVVESRDM